VTKILFIAYHFPPVGGAGVQRAAKFARYLVEEGFLPVVVTGPGPERDRWTPEDASLLDEIPKDVAVRRLSLPSGPQRKSLARRLGFGTPFPPWWAQALLGQAEDIGRAEQVKLVFATMSPFETAEPAAELARRLGVPFVADLRDPWALDETMIHPSRLHLAVEMSHMRRALVRADTVVMNTPESAAQLQRAFPEFRGRRVATITNGYDADDFRSPVAAKTDGTFTILHAGYLHTETGEALQGKQRLFRALGGVAPGLDVLARSHVYLLRAMVTWMKSDPEAAEKARLVLVGGLTARDRAAIDASPLARNVETPGYLAHAETLRRVRSADLLFLPLHALPAGARATIVPGKTYEYIASGRRILAALPGGDARDFVAEAGTGLSCEPNDCDGMVRALKEAFALWKRGEPPRAVPPDHLRRFERRTLTRQLADEFRRLVK
jgi:glycosyltransferase involved in cell wall biosynthesis